MLVNNNCTACLLQVQENIKNSNDHNRKKRLAGNNSNNSELPLMRVDT